MEDVHFVHVAQAFTDLPDEHHCVELRQLVVLVNDSVKEFSSINTVQEKDQHRINFPVLTFLNNCSLPSYSALVKVLSYSFFIITTVHYIKK